MLGGEWLIAILFSAEFAPAAALLFLLLPADLLRVSAETTGLPLLARASLLPYALVYLLWATSFLAIANQLIPLHGLTGVGFAYIASQVVNLVSVLFLSNRYGDSRWDWGSVSAMSRAVLVVFAVAAVLFFDLPTLFKLFLIAFMLGFWVVLTARDSQFRHLLSEIRGTDVGNG